MPNPQHIVGGNIRRRRQNLGLSQQTLAERADLSRRMITLIEAGDGNASLARLDRLAAALKIAFADLIRRPDPIAVTNPLGLPEVAAWQSADPRSFAHLLQSSSATETVELWSWSLAPGERYNAEPDRPGMRELIYITRGSMSLELPDATHKLTAGQSIGFASDRAYAYVNIGKGPLTFVKNVVI